MKHNRYAQLKENTDNPPDNNIVNFVPSSTYYIELEGNLFLIPKEHNNQDRVPININKWKQYPNIYKFFLKAFVEHYKTSTASTVNSSSHIFEKSFFKFLTEMKLENINLGEIDQSLLSEYQNWLNGLRENRIARWSEKSRDQKHGILWNLIGKIQKLEDGKCLIGLVKPKNPWPRSSASVKPVEGFGENDLLAIYEACCSEIKVINQLYHEAKAIISNRNEAYSSKNFDMTDVKILKTINKQFPDQVYPKKNGIIEIFGKHLNRKPFWKKYAQVFCPTKETIVPFIVLMAIHFNANTSCVLDAKIEDFEKTEVFGQKRTQWNFRKNRASKIQRRSLVEDDEIDNPKSLINFIIKYTAVIRKNAKFSIKNNLFIYSSSQVGITSFDTLYASNLKWNTALANFSMRNNLIKFNLQQLRQAVLDSVDDLFNGDIFARKTSAQHQNIQVTKNHYTSAYIKRNNRERLSGGINEYERYASSKGKIKNSGSSGLYSSATPGFDCSDPFNSPIEGQSEKLCTAYGRCPGCGLAKIDGTNGASFAHIFNLKLAIEKSQSQINSFRYAKIWVPILKKIDRVWLKAFTQKAQNDAKKIDLPPPPTIE